MNNKGESAVIGVILMVAITVAIAGTVYFYAVSMSTDPNYTPSYPSYTPPTRTQVNFTGVLYGFYDDDDNNDPIIIGNTTIHNVCRVDERYLYHLIGYDITLLLEHVEYSNREYYNYIGAYIKNEVD